MQAAPSRWIRLTPTSIAALPNADGVFEVANLVRNVQYVGRACGRLRDTLTEFGHMPRNLPLSVGGYFFRFELTTAEGEAFERRIEAYRKRHEGAVPPGNRGQVIEFAEPAAPVRMSPVVTEAESQQAA